MKILVVDDEKVLVKGIKFNLESEGYQVEAGYDGEEAVELARSGSFDLIILDLMMPKIDGLQACMRIREFSNVPIIMLTARSEDTDKIIGFECGADDYITKPFNPMEVIARLKAHLRRAGNSAPKTLTVGALTLDTAAMQLYKDGRPILLTPTEYKILAQLMGAPGRIFTKVQLYEGIAGEYFESNDNTMMVHISNLRAKVEDDPSHPKYIKTVRGLGYKIEET